MENNVVVAIVIQILLKKQNVLEAPATNPTPILAAAIECEPEEGVRIQNYAEEVIARYSITTFKSHFRMTPTAFEAVLNAVGGCPEMNKRDEDFGGRNQVSVEKTLLIAVWTLATPESYRSVADRFDVVKSTVFYCIKRTVAALVTHICKNVIVWPHADNRAHTAEGFQRYGFEHCIGAIDGCHIPIRAPTVNAGDYINRKNFHSVILQAVCDSNMFFTDCDISWPGSVHDARVLRNSEIHTHAVEYFDDGQFILGDAAYPCLEWLMPPFKNNGRLTPAQVYYNTQLSSTRNVIERTFALLKGRFRRLKYLEMYSIVDTNLTVLACCVLHNICLRHDDDVEEYIRENLHEDVPNLPFAERNDQAMGRVRREQIVDLLWARRRQ